MWTVVVGDLRVLEVTEKIEKEVVMVVGVEGMDNGREAK